MNTRSTIRRSFVAALAASAVALFGVSCHSIADIPEVKYSEACNAYCEGIKRTCLQPNVQYPDDGETCVKTCHMIEAEADGATATSGANTLACRTENLKNAAIALENNAASDVKAYCANAGPGGGSQCTGFSDKPNCEGYCTLYTRACDGKTSNPFNAEDTVGNFSDCVTRCAAVQPSPGDFNYVSEEVRKGDTLACRLYNALLAVKDPSDANCKAAGLRPTPACETAEPDCKTFCRASQVACGNTFFENQAQCEKVCEVIPKGTNRGDRDSDKPSNTIGCRITHVFMALLVSPKDHCPHTGPLGGGFCGEVEPGADPRANYGDCNAYCRLAKAGCQSEYESRFADDERCIDECAGLGGDGGHSGEHGTVDYSVAAALKSGDTVQCRALQASRAIAEANEENRAALCQSVFGGAAPCR